MPVMSTSSPLAALGHRLQGGIVRAVLGLPAPAKRLIAGAPVVRDGQTLDLDTQCVLRLQQLTHERGAETFPIEEGRVVLEHQADLFGGRLPIGEVRDDRAGGVPVRVYRPRNLVGRTTPLPTLVFVHGGGFIYGGEHGTHDSVCRFFAEHADVQVVSIDYRLAPEHPFPAAHDDTWAAYRALVTEPDRWQIDPERVAVGGDSAGGNLAAHVAVEAARAGLPLTFQLLVYPMAQASVEAPSRTMFDDGFFLTREFLDRAEGAYLGAVGACDDPRVDLVNADLPTGIAPAHVVTAGFDPLRDEGELYAQRLLAAGGKVSVHREQGLIHGFVNWTGVRSTSRDAVLALTRILRTALHV